ncbi:MAG TPA: hypothetical protein VGV61_10580 [Thermoanaerobaculia bacterium]|jgi:hypothetical protein|nr:hypothetical protein [Thermoanaerobaculia bacterium]
MVRGRSFWARHLAAVLLLGAVHWHADAEPLTAGLVVHSEVYYPDLPWHGHRIHLDAAAAASRAPCPVCLHQLQTRGAHLVPLAGLAAPSVLAVVAAPAAAAERFRGLRCHAARGPPLSLLA